MIFTPDFLKGTLTTIILSLLDQNGKMYGYEICQKTKEQSNSTIVLTEGAIYPALHKLEKKGIILSSKEQVNGRVRKYYKINKEKNALVKSQIDALHNFMHALQFIVQPKNN